MRYTYFLPLLSLSIVTINGDACIQTMPDSSPLASYEQLSEALRTHRTQVTHACTSFSLSLIIQHDTQYDSQAWNKIQTYFEQLKQADLHDNSPYDQETVSLVGQPLKTVVTTHTPDNGILDTFAFECASPDADDDEDRNSCRLSMQVSQDVIIEISNNATDKNNAQASESQEVHTTKDYDHQAWDTISNACIDFAEKFTPTASAHKLATLCCPSLAPAFAHLEEESGIHVEITMTIQDDTHTLTLRKTFGTPKKEQ